MPGVMLLSREAKRVPLNFDWPLNKVWDGYLSPDPRWPTCAKCGGDGIHPFAKPIEKTFYALDVDATREQYAWHNKITQDEVDHLVAEGRLSTWVKDDPERGGRWERLPRDADEVNAHSLGLGGHDAINRWKLVRYRCDRLGIPCECDECAGHGNLATDEQRAEADQWKPTEPPTGEGWQMWESVSEGSPISPVCATPELLAEWMTAHDDSITSSMTYTDWLAAIGGEVIGTNIASGNPVRST